MSSSDSDSSASNGDVAPLKSPHKGIIVRSRSLSKIIEEDSESDLEEEGAERTRKKDKKENGRRRAILNDKPRIAAERSH